MREKAWAAGIIRFFLGRSRWAGMASVALAGFLSTSPAWSNDFKLCQDCHEVLLDEMFRTYPHLPFLQQRCAECHTPKESPTQFKDEIASNTLDRKKIDWLGESLMTDVQHAFILQGEKEGDTLVVETRGEDGTFLREEITVPFLNRLPEVEDSGLPPLISGVSVLKVERGVFLSATIGWETDSLSDSLVRYGNPELTMTSQTGGRLGQWHEVVLHNLEPDRTYLFSVVSHDLFGRSQASDPLTFTTLRPSSAPRPDPPAIQPEGDQKAGLRSAFRRVGKDFLLELSLKRPAAVFLGTKKGPPKPRTSGKPVLGLESGDKYHAGLSSRKFASLDACGICHKYQTSATHPVNVFPKPGMTIPPEYPTLPDGRITCRSCHETHSSDNEFLAIKARKKELCVGCHKDML